MREMTLNPLRILTMSDIDTEEFVKKSIDGEIFYGGWLNERKIISSSQIISEINECRANVLIVEVEDITDEVFRNCPSLEVVATLRSNPVNVDILSAQNHGVIVLNTPGRNANAVAELTICLIIDALRNVSTSYFQMTDGIWGVEKDDPYLRYRGFELANKVVGLIGFGMIGQRVASLLSCFGAEVMAYDPYQPESLFQSMNVKKVMLEELLVQSDIISIHIPHNKNTDKLLDADRISQIKDGAILINTARAQVIDRDALYSALSSKKIRSASVDVFYEEPPENDPILSLENVIFTPHIGGATYDVIKSGSKMIANDLARILDNQEPINKVQPNH